MKLVNLEIRTWRGFSPGAVHYYGSLKFRDLNGEYKKIELKRIIGEEEAKEFSEKDRWNWYAGSETERFNSWEDIKKLAIETYKKHCPDADALIEGPRGILNPQEVLDGSEEFMTKGSELYHRSEEIGGYEGNPKEMTKISDEWLELIGWYEKEENKNV